MAISVQKKRNRENGFCCFLYTSVTGLKPRSESELDRLRVRRGMTADTAIRLSRVLKTTPDIWMNLQKAVDLWDASQANKRDYAKLRPIAA
jgi:plasmid maintenance system antidote protein VapI